MLVKYKVFDIPEDYDSFSFPEIIPEYNLKNQLPL
jgi:hypothetical protein